MVGLNVETFIILIFLCTRELHRFLSLFSSTTMGAALTTEATLSVTLSFSIFSKVRSTFDYNALELD